MSEYVIRSAGECPFMALLHGMLRTRGDIP